QRTHFLRRRMRRPQIRTMTGNLSARGTITGSKATEISLRIEKGSRVRIANDQPASLILILSSKPTSAAPLPPRHARRLWREPAPAHRLVSGSRPRHDPDRAAGARGRKRAAPPPYRRAN